MPDSDSTDSRGDKGIHNFNILSQVILYEI